MRGGDGGGAKNVAIFSRRGRKNWGLAGERSNQFWFTHSLHSPSIYLPLALDLVSRQSPVLGPAPVWKQGSTCASTGSMDALIMFGPHRWNGLQPGPRLDNFLKK